MIPAPITIFFLEKLKFHLYLLFFYESDGTPTIIPLRIKHDCHGNFINEY